MKEHNFKLVPDSKALDFKSGLERQKFRCDKCRTLVSYPTRYTEFDVNKAITDAKIPCLDPLVEAN